ncbi:MAG: RluA family pseudouridine synthase [Treponema sp.]|jgi:23S rRNA pseudouridine955/2504/2580 synthase|nr:RluA family pseudouridine synthase [Treponema sp.]
MMMCLTAAADDDGRRLDRVLRKALPGLPLQALYRLFRKGKILVDHIEAGPGKRIKAGQIIELPRTCTPDPQPPGKTHPPSAPPAGLKVLYEGEGLLFINKASGLAVHGPDSLEEQVQSYLKDKTAPSLSFRSGPLHRLDKPTSGLIVFSTNLEGARHFSRLIRERKVRKLYLALVDGTLLKSQIWEDELIRDKKLQKTIVVPKGEISGDAKTGRTLVSPLASAKGHSLILAEIESGRTHQIRAQAAEKGHPLSGDKKYGGKALPGKTLRGGGFFLHAWKLEAEGRRIEAPLPENFLAAITEFFGKEFEGKFQGNAE